MRNLDVVSDGREVKIVRDVNVNEFALTKIQNDDNINGVGSFYVCNLCDLLDKYKLLTSLLPNFQINYNIGSCDDVNVIKVLSQLGCHFSCTNKTELRKLLQMEVNAESICYSNSCKQSSHIKYAAERGVKLLAAESEVEIKKIAAKHPDAGLVLSVRTSSSVSAANAMEWSTGCQIKKVRSLLKYSRLCGLSVCGLSTQCDEMGDMEKVCEMLVSLQRVYEVCLEEGFQPTFITIADFTSSVPASDYKKACMNLREAVNYYFPSQLGVKFVVEAGQFIIESAFTLCSTVVMKRPTDCDDVSYDYYLNDGVYGAFTRLLAGLKSSLTPPTLLSKRQSSTYRSSLFGPTGDSLDSLLVGCDLPELVVGDWVTFSHFPFTLAPRDSIYYVMDETHWYSLCCHHLAVDSGCVPLTVSRHDIASSDSFSSELKSLRSLENQSDSPAGTSENQTVSSKAEVDDEMQDDSPEM